MIDKVLVKKRFLKSFKTYDENAYIQKITAKKLVKLIEKKQYDYILEVGSATGILTKEIKNNISFISYSANDIVENSSFYIDKIIPDNTFIPGDIEKIQLKNKYDLIISNACLQWCNDIKTVILNLYNSLNINGILAVSIFGDDNLKEIREIFKIENRMYRTSDLEQFVKGFNLKFFQAEKNIQYYNSLTQILKQLKNTGVNGIKEFKLTKLMLKEYEKNYFLLYSENGQLTLTYNPLYIIIEKV